MTVFDIILSNSSLVIPLALLLGLPIGLILYGIVAFNPYKNSKQQNYTGVNT